MRKKRLLSGFTLIETIVALAFLCLIFLDMAEIIKIGYGAGLRSKKYVSACNLAREKLEGYSQAASLPSIGTTTENYGTISNYSDFKRQTSVSAYSSYSSSDLVQISVTVYWNSDKHSVSAATLEAVY